MGAVVSVINFVDILFEIVIWMVIIRVLLSWFGNPRNGFTNFVASIADPILIRFRRIVPPMGMLDLSPIVAIISLEVLNYLIVELLKLI